tara:strand:+ start:2568 stop:3896 length:1329 start_codon:yes stop_codon:yes gene_type:complete
MYRRSDLDVIIEKVNQIETGALKYYQDNYEEPTKEEYDDVMNEIKKFVKNEGLIIYGGYAQNKLIGIKNKSDEFYSETDRPDLEFYSPTPIKDSMKLSEILHNKGYKYVVCEEGIHNETYKIFVNFLTFSDISYMDPYVFENCPFVIVDGLKLTDPLFMQVDAYRVYADLLTSNFRLNKTISRMSSLLNYYSFDEKNEFNQISYKSSEKEKNVLRYIRKHVIHDSKLIVIGQYAYNYLVKKVNDKYVINVEYYQLISSEFKKDFDKILKILKNKFGKKISYQLYHPFFQFLDERVEFLFEGKVILKLYGNNSRCIVYQYSEKKKTYFGTFILIILHLMIDYNHAKIDKNKKEENNNEALILRLNNIRNEYLDKKNLTVLDKSPFQEFSYKCIGTPVDPIRSARLKIIEKKEAGKKLKFRYSPSGGEGKVPSYNFKNSSGLKL